MCRGEPMCSPLWRADTWVCPCLCLPSYGFYLFYRHRSYAYGMIELDWNCMS
jgi:hypothetical protein